MLLLQSVDLQTQLVLLFHLQLIQPLQFFVLQLKLLLAAHDFVDLRPQLVVVVLVDLSVALDVQVLLQLVLQALYLPVLLI